ncbi:LacI family DNA-binding transcriptional regulator [Tessaracoccus sp. Z1128]
MTPRPTLQDVGAIAGVSAKTVSNVLLGRPNVSEVTRARVWEAVAATGYVVNAAGRGLASGRTGRIALVVPNLHQPYFAEMAERLMAELAPRGLTSTLIIAQAGADERRVVVGDAAPGVDGVIILPHALSWEMPDVAPPRPVVQLGGARTAGLDWVAMGERIGMRLVTEHLLAQGHRRFVALWNGEIGVDPSERFGGILDALGTVGLGRDDVTIVTGSDWDRRESGYEAMAGLLRTGQSFDAVVSVNDALAVGAMRALRDAGLRIPEDVAVTGFDDTEEGAFLLPALTSVSPEAAAMAGHAVRLLVDRLDGYAGPPREVHTGAHLVARASTGHPPGGPGD